MLAVRINVLLVWRTNFYFLIQDTVILYQNNCVNKLSVILPSYLHQHCSINLIKIMICRLTVFTIFSQYLTVVSRYLKGGLVMEGAPCLSIFWRPTYT